MEITKKYLGTMYNDWYFLTLLVLIGLIAIYTSLNMFPFDLGMASLIVLIVVLFFSFEDIMPHAREVRRRKFKRSQQ